MNLFEWIEDKIRTAEWRRTLEDFKWKKKIRFLRRIVMEELSPPETSERN